MEKPFDYNINRLKTLKNGVKSILNSLKTQKFSGGGEYNFNASMIVASRMLENKKIAISGRRLKDQNVYYIAL